MPRTFKDLSLRITSDGQGGFKVLVLDSPAGTGEDALTLSLQRDELERLRQDLNGLLLGRRDVHRPTEPKEIGSRLFKALFLSQTLSLLQRSLGRVEDQGRAKTRHGLRLRLHFNLADPLEAWLAGLPWELLYSDQEKRFLLLDPDVSLVRCLVAGVPPRRPRIQGPLRILVVSSDLHENRPRIDANGEWQQILASWKDSPSVQLVRLDQPSLADVDEHLAAGDFHVLHFIGHSRFDPQNGHSYLALRRDLRVEEVTGEDLAVRLRAYRHLHLVVLNSCRTAAFSHQDGRDPFAGVAHALIGAGIPAVVAMQSSITDKSALAFCNGFYDCLAAGEAIDTAMAEGRRRVHLHSRSSEWAAPVLYAASQSGDPFRVGKKRIPRQRLLLQTTKPIKRLNPRQERDARRRVAEGLALSLRVLPSDLKILRREHGATTVLAELPEVTADALLAAWEKKDKDLRKHLESLGFHNVQRVEFSWKLWKPLMMVTVVVLGLLTSSHPSQFSSLCPEVQIARVEVDLPGGPRLLRLDGNRITRLTTADLLGVRYLTGRAVLENGSGCSCVWMGNTDQEPTMQGISSPERHCAFQIPLPDNYSRINLRLAAGPQDHLFTIELPQ